MARRAILFARVLRFLVVNVIIVIIIIDGAIIETNFYYFNDFDRRNDIVKITLDPRYNPMDYSTSSTGDWIDAPAVDSSWQTFGG